MALIKRIQTPASNSSAGKSVVDGTIDGLSADSSADIRNVSLANPQPIKIVNNGITESKEHAGVLLQLSPCEMTWTLPLTYQHLLGFLKT